MQLTPTEEEWDKLISAVEAWENKEQGTVMYRKFLDSTYSRETVSVHGIFPKVQQKELSKFD
jgi:hypothetical protein